MPMKDPPHPGLSILIDCLEPLGLTVTKASELLGVARHTLSRVLHGHAAISPEMAIRLEKAGWSNADFWMRRQAAYDLAQARKHEDRIKVERCWPPDARPGLDVRPEVLAADRAEEVTRSVRNQEDVT